MIEGGAGKRRREGEGASSSQDDAMGIRRREEDSTPRVNARGNVGTGTEYWGEGECRVGYIASSAAPGGSGQSREGPYVSLLSPVRFQDVRRQSYVGARLAYVGAADGSHFRVVAANGRRAIWEVGQVG